MNPVRNHTVNKIMGKSRVLYIKRSLFIKKLWIEKSKKGLKTSTTL